MEFNSSVTSIMSSLMVVASASMIVPSALYSMASEDSSGSNKSVKFLSVVTSVILLIFYVVYLFFRLKTHSRLFLENQDEDEHKLGIISSAIFLFLAALGVNFCSDYLVDSIDGVVDALHISRAFIGLIVVPFVGNAGQAATSINAAKRDKLDLAIGLVVESTLQIALFVTPLMVIVGWFIHQPMTLRFDTFETTVFSLSVIVVNYIIQDGRTNYFAGALLIGT
jgi:calcium/proton exchanger